MSPKVAVLKIIVMAVAAIIYAVIIKGNRKAYEETVQTALTHSGMSIIPGFTAAGISAVAFVGTKLMAPHLSVIFAAALGIICFVGFFAAAPVVGYRIKIDPLLKPIPALMTGMVLITVISVIPFVSAIAVILGAYGFGVVITRLNLKKSGVEFSVVPEDSQTPSEDIVKNFSSSGKRNPVSALVAVLASVAMFAAVLASGGKPPKANNADGEMLASAESDTQNYDNALLSEDGDYQLPDANDGIEDAPSDNAPSDTSVNTAAAVPGQDTFTPETSSPAPMYADASDAATDAPQSGGESFLPEAAAPQPAASSPVSAVPVAKQRPPAKGTAEQLLGDKIFMPIIELDILQNAYKIQSGELTKEDFYANVGKWNITKRYKDELFAGVENVLAKGEQVAPLTEDEAMQIKEVQNQWFAEYKKFKAKTAKKRVAKKAAKRPAPQEEYFEGDLDEFPVTDEMAE